MLLCPVDLRLFVTTNSTNNPQPPPDGYLVLPSHEHDIQQGIAYNPGELQHRPYSSTVPTRSGRRPVDRRTSSCFETAMDGQNRDGELSERAEQGQEGVTESNSGRQRHLPVATFEERFEQFYLQLANGKTGGMVVSDRKIRRGNLPRNRHVWKSLTPDEKARLRRAGL